MVELVECHALHPMDGKRWWAMDDGAIHNLESRRALPRTSTYVTDATRYFWLSEGKLLQLNHSDGALFDSEQRCHVSVRESAKSMACWLWCSVFASLAISVFECSILWPIYSSSLSPSLGISPPNAAQWSTHNCLQGHAGISELYEWGYILQQQFGHETLILAKQALI